MNSPLTLHEFFVGVGGLSEAFIQEGYESVAHVEADVAACNTLWTRMAHHWLAAAGQIRERVVLAGWRKRTGAAYPEPERWIPDVTVGEVFCDLPPIGAGEGSARPCRRLPHHSRWQAEAGVGSTLPPDMASRATACRSPSRDQPHSRQTVERTQVETSVRLASPAPEDTSQPGFVHGQVQGGGG